MKLGKRLKHIESMVTSGYDHIWDCCCDHGLLGAALLSRQAAPNIHFVDIVPELMSQLNNKLTRFYPQNSKTLSSVQWQVHCIDVAELPLEKFPGKNLIIIAGVGGELMTEFIKKIHQNNPLAEIDFLLSPVNDPFILRQQLIQFDFSLQTEILIAENQRYYEALLVSTVSNPGSKITNVGNAIWQSNTAEQAKNAENYLKKILAHYKRKQLSSHESAKNIIDAYRAVIM